MLVIVLSWVLAKPLDLGTNLALSNVNVWSYLIAPEGCEEAYQSSHFVMELSEDDKSAQSSSMHSSQELEVDSYLTSLERSSQQTPLLRGLGSAGGEAYMQLVRNP